MQQLESHKELFKKLVKVLGSLDHVKKTGFNAHQNYQYATEADIIEVVRDKLVKEGVFIFSSVEGIEKTDNITTVKVLHTFVDSDSGATFSVYSYGQGADKQDKGVYKAITGATKYMYQKNFMIASEDDPENDGANASYVRNKPTKTVAAKTVKPATVLSSNDTKTGSEIKSSGAKPTFSAMKKVPSKVEEEVPY